MIKIVLEKKLQAANGPLILQIDTQIDAGQFITLYGKSGVGKTSILRMLAGLNETRQRHNSS